MPIALLGLATTGKGDLGVSLSLNILYHAPAVTFAFSRHTLWYLSALIRYPLARNDRLRIVSTTLSLGSRALSSRCEVSVSSHPSYVLVYPSFSPDLECHPTSTGSVWCTHQDGCLRSKHAEQALMSLR